jgi:hypothetical protein
MVGKLEIYAPLSELVVVMEQAVEVTAAHVDGTGV